MLRNRIGLGLALVALLGFGGQAEATRVQRLTLTEIRDNAETVVLGTVTGSTTRVGPEGKMVWTDYRLQVQRTMLGPSQGPVLTVSFAGGRHGALDVGIAGVPVLETGETYVLFLRRNQPFAVPAVGWDQGLFLVRDVDVAGRRQTVLISLAGDEPLEMTVGGKIRRGARVKIQDETLFQVSQNRESSTATPRQEEPVVRNADGTVPRPLPAPPKAGEATPLAERRFATLEDLQRFLDRDLREISRGELAEGER